MSRIYLLPMAVALAICLLFFATLDNHPLLSTIDKMDWFFGADNPRVFENLRNSGDWTHERDRLHPFFSLFAVSVAQLPALMGFHDLEFITYRMVFGTAGTMLFFVLVLEATSPLQAFASLALLLSTMSLRLFSTLPESFLFGFFTIMLGLYLIRRNAHPVAVLIASMASATTNIGLGAIYALRRITSLRNALIMGVGFLVVAVLLACLQVRLYRTSDYFFNLFAVRDETRYLSRSLGDLPFRAFDFLFSGFVMPLQASILPPLDSRQEWNAFVADGYVDRAASMAVVVALLAVAALYASSIRSFLGNKARTHADVALGAFILYQFVFHMIYGDSPFLYSLHFLPASILFFSLNRPPRLQQLYGAGFFVLAAMLLWLNLLNFGQVIR